MYDADEVKPKIVKILVDRILEVNEENCNDDEESLESIAKGVQALAAMGFFVKMVPYKDPYKK